MVDRVVAGSKAARQLMARSKPVIDHGVIYGDPEARRRAREIADWNKRVDEEKARKKARNRG